MESIKTTTLVLLALALGVSLYFNFEKNPPVPNSETETDSSEGVSREAFLKKVECAKYQTAIEKKLEGEAFENPANGFYTSSFLDHVFYSERSNSCLYLARELSGTGSKLEYQVLKLGDALSGNLLATDICEFATQNCIQKETDFERYYSENY